MKLIVGLGNPGRKYQKTRHNIGFLVIDELASTMNAKLKMQSDMKSEVLESSFSGEKVILAKPQTFMNKSREAVEALKNKYKLDLADIWIVSDDATMEFGKMRVRQGGSSGGHNGLKSIIGLIGENFVRARIGVGVPEGQIPMDKWVLGKFPRDQKKQLGIIAKKASGKITEAINNSNETFDTEDLLS